MTGQLSAHERRRLEVLERCHILDTAPEAAFERPLELAQRLFNVPVVLLSFLTTERQWVKAARGFEGRELSVQASPCARTLDQRRVRVVLDMDEEDGDKPGPDFPLTVRFYAGAPLVCAGYTVGTLCLIDEVPRAAFTAEDEKALADLAAMTVSELELRLARPDLQSQTERASKIFERITEATYTLDRDGRFTALNAQAETLLRRSKAELLGQELWKAFPETRRSPLYDRFQEASASQRAQVFEYYYRPWERWFEVHAYPSDEGLAVYFQDISERKAYMRKAEIQATFRRNLIEFTHASLQRELSEDFYQRLVENAVQTIPGAQAGSLAVRSGDKHRFMAAVGFDLAALQRVNIDMAVQKQFSPDRFEPQLVKRWSIASVATPFQKVMVEQGRVGDIKVSLCVPIPVNGQHALTLYLDNFESADVFDDESVELTRLLAQQAATLMQRLELEQSLRRERAELERLAHFDGLTGLPNRASFHSRLQLELERHNPEKTALAVLFLDLDNFKDVNDSRGHDFGDVFLRAVAARLKSRLKGGDTLARWGGDEFVVVLPGLTRPSEAAEVARRLLDTLRQPFVIEGRTLHTSISVGIALRTSVSEQVETLLKQADTALYEAKKQRNTFYVFSDAMMRQLQHKVQLSADFRAALDQNAITLHYQPRYRLEDGAITSVEALARWYHPVHGAIAPDTFIALAEELGVIGQLGRQILTLACAQARSWQLTNTPCRVAVNLSVQQLRHPQIVAEVRDTLLLHGLEPQFLELELTESTAMADVQDSIAKLQQFADMGIYLSIDDFGTAYSSLAYLKRLPVDSLKIDRSFVRDIDVPSRSDTRVVEAIIALGKSLELCVVAEGVETVEQRQFLEALGCDMAQGYLFAKPLPAEDVEKLFRPDTVLAEP